MRVQREGVRVSDVLFSAGEVLQTGGNAPPSFTHLTARRRVGFCGRCGTVTVVDQTQTAVYLDHHNVRAIVWGFPYGVPGGGPWVRTVGVRVNAATAVSSLLRV